MEFYLNKNIMAHVQIDLLEFICICRAARVSKEDISMIKIFVLYRVS